jgi:hypothetical protein
MAMPPKAGHHIQWMGSLWKPFSQAYTDKVRMDESMPAGKPQITAEISPGLFTARFLHRKEWP